MTTSSGAAGTTQSSIIARNSAPTNPDYRGNFNSRGNNLIQNTAGITGTFAASDITGVDPLLNPLADNGGSTKTHQLMQTSPAIDKGVSANQTTDQRGFTRKVDFETPNGAGDGTDIGSFELQVLTPVVTSFTISGSNTVRANTSVTFTVTFNRSVIGADPSDFQIITTGNITNAQKTGFVGGGGGGSVVMITVSTGTTEPGTIQLRLVDDDSIRAISDNTPLGGAGAGNGSADSEILFVSLPDVTAPANPVTQIGTTSPNGEEVAKAIDNTTDKYLNFGGAGSGFTVTPSSGSVVTSLRFYTANDSPERDLASYILEGSNNGDTTWIQISAGNLALPDGRNAAGQQLTASKLFFQTVSFSNTVGYTGYRLTFPTLKGTGANVAMQIGEVEFPGASLAPTAANAAISGRVISGHRGVARAVVQMTGQSGNIQTARTNAFGYYRFAEVEAGQTYIINVFSKQFQFTPQVVNLNENLTDVNFYAAEKFGQIK